MALFTKKSAVLDLLQLQAGEPHAWEQFANEFTALIYAFSRKTLERYRSSPDPDDVEEVVQNVFLRLIKEDYHLLKSYDPARGAFSTWLKTVSQSATVDFVRRTAPPSMSLEAADRVPAAVPTPQTTLEFPDGILSDREKLILKLLFDEELSAAEIAGILGIEIQSVYAHKHKALNKLRKFYAPEPQA